MWTQRIGKIGQDITQKYFENNGYLLIAKNWHSRYGEIDLILRKCRKMPGVASGKCEELIFCEVKTRVIHGKSVAEILAGGKMAAGAFGGRFGSGEEALDRRKRGKILKTIFVYLEKNYEFSKISWRLDLVCVKILKNTVSLDHYRNISILD